MPRDSSHRLFFVLLVCSSYCCAWRPAQAESPRSVVTWEFGTEETTRVTVAGGVHRDQPGPRPPEFPGFDASNTAVKLDGRGARLMLADPGPGSDFDFDTGDEITLEAWVNIAEPLGHNRNLYVIGKGRTGDKRFGADNQNWALRIRSIEGEGRISFLFATPKRPGQKSDAHWHRWTSNQGFYPGTGWHRIAVAYTFGQPESMRGWLNDKPATGKWDMGGATHEAPVVDDDAIWIGSTSGGNDSNSFRGLIDEVSIFRQQLTDQQMAARYQRVGPERSLDAVPEVVPDLKPVAGAVAVRLSEGLPTHDRWLPAEMIPAQPTMEYSTTSLLFSRLPRRYDDWGIRASWRSTVLLQAAAEIYFPSGQHQLLLRARGLSRLWLGDRVVARIGVRKGGSDGHNPVEPLPEPPAPEHRRLGHGDQEELVTIDIAEAGVYPVILESWVGSAKARVEPGEMLVARRLQDQSDYELLQPAGFSAAPVRLIDREFAGERERAERQLGLIDDQQRRAAAASQDDYWRERHGLARRWVEQNPPPAVPDGLDGWDGQHPIDRFLAAKIAAAQSTASDESHGDVAEYQQAVLPILREHCLRCHGEGAEGGLQLTSRAALLEGGDSGEPAVVPGQPEHSPLIHRVRSTDEGLRMPPSGGLSQQQMDTLERWIGGGLSWGRQFDPELVRPAPLIDDAAFIRRAYLDTWGVPPPPARSRAFLHDSDPEKRARLVAELVADPQLADHWVSYWQDVLAENPNILKPSLNNTGPFRYFLHEALRDGKPLDRLVSELVMLRGSEREGGSAGFGMAADNDAPLATRGLVLASAFLGIDLQCARCHDSPYHSTTQQDLFSLAAMLARKPLSVPASSTVAPGFFDQLKDRTPLVRVTLPPGVPVQPQWNFAATTGAEDGPWLNELLRQPEDSRERLALLMTAPANERFAAVLVNRIWKRLMGAGLVEPVDDWEARRASHPELLTWLARQLVANGYDLRRAIQLVMTSQAYQRVAVGKNLQSTAEDRFFSAPDRRRLTAEQVVDSLGVAAGQRLRVEELTFDNDGRRPATTMISLGIPRRAWEFATLSNERDRPSLALPRAQAVTDVLEAFGWNGSRQNAVTERAVEPNVLQPGILANGVMAGWIARASCGSALAELAVQAESAAGLLDELYLRFLVRLPEAAERDAFTGLLAAGFDRRLLPKTEIAPVPHLPPLGYVSWTNHLRGEANEIKLEQERRARMGDPVDPRLAGDWREAYEDVVWTLINSPEFVWVP